MGKRIDFRLGKVSGPPDGTAWVWHTITLRASAAWKSRSPQCVRLLEALELEHLRHGGSENGQLKQTFAQISVEGVQRKFISATIKEAEELGLLDANRGARKSRSESHMTTFRLTYLPSREISEDGRPYYVAPTDEWRLVTSERAAAIATEARRQRAKASEGRRKNKIRFPEREPNQYPNGNQTSTRTGTAPLKTGGNARAENAEPVPEREPPYISWPYAVEEPAALDRANVGQPTLPPSCDQPSETLDIEEYLGSKTRAAISPTEKLRADLKARLQGAPKGEQTRVAKLVNLSRPQIANFVAGRFNVNSGAAALLRRYADGEIAA